VPVKFSKCLAATISGDSSPHIVPHRGTAGSKP
jgi:hypothetical protein